MQVEPGHPVIGLTDVIPALGVPAQAGGAVTVRV